MSDRKKERRGIVLEGACEGERIMKRSKKKNEKRNDGDRYNGGRKQNVYVP